MQSSNNLKKTIFFIIISSISTIFAQNIDIDLLRDINLNRDQSLDQTFKFLSDTDAPIAIATPMIIYSMGLLNKDKNLKKQAIFIGESLLVSTFITTAAKYSFKRVRPFTTYPELEKQSDVAVFRFHRGIPRLHFLPQPHSALPSQNGISSHPLLSGQAPLAIPGWILAFTILQTF
jgi:hypothetical protein